jgi:putative oxidoreductase
MGRRCGNPRALEVFEANCELAWARCCLGGTLVGDFLAYVVFGMEAVGGILLVLGVRTREVAAALIPILAGALWVHAGNGWVFSNAGGGWEYPLYLVVLSAAQVLLGEGAFALSRSSMPSQRSTARLTA